MKTLFDLIYEWKGLKDQAERMEVQARKARHEANDLEAKLRDALLEHGPVMACTELFLPPENPHDPIRILNVHDAINIALPQTETTNPNEGGAV